MSVRWAKRLALIAAILVQLGGASHLFAAHPLLAEAPENIDWHAPASGNEAVYIGKDPQAQPRLVLKKQAVRNSRLRLELATDADTLVIESGGESLSVPLIVGRVNQVELDGDEVSPRLRVNRTEPADLRGPWIRLLLHSGADEIALRFANAQYVNVTFGGRNLPNPNFTAATRRITREPENSPLNAPGADGANAGAVDAVDAANVPVQPGEAPAVAPTPRRPAEPSVEHAVTPDLMRAHQEPDWRHSFKMGFDLTNAYYFRGIGQENQDLIVQPYVDAKLELIQEGDAGWIDGLDFIVGMRTSHHFGPTGDVLQGVGADGRRINSDEREKFFELGFHGGATVQIERFEFGVFYLNRIGVNDQIRDVHEFDFLLTYDDKDPNFDWQLSPYLLLAVEFEGESDAGNYSGPLNEGIYLEAGVRPEFKLWKLAGGQPITLAIPVAVGLSLSDYYQDLQGSDDVFGYLKFGAEAGFPILTVTGEGGRPFIVKANAGAHVLVFGDSVRQINELNGTSDSSVQFIGTVGMSLEF